ncbi:predicted protein [Fusobacterium sp. CAG:439]|nr:predicted protein [Fusobacterium sp. CAG:439]
MNVLPVSITNYKSNLQEFRAAPVFTAKLKPISAKQCSELKVFCHHIYEYKKGLRNLILTTEKISNKDYITARLEKEKIPYIIHPAGERTINVFFGNEDCIKVVATFDKHLNKLSNEQDFMLGIMLGYDKILQCQRYIKRLGKNANTVKG